MVKPTNTKDEKIITENLLIEASGVFYLKVPKTFKQTFPNWSNVSPVPILTEADGKIRLCYEWSRADIVKC